MELKAQHKWHWDHAVYLFLGGLGAAAYIWGVIADFSGAGWETIAVTGKVFGFISLAIGYIVLLLGLGIPANAIHAMKRPGTAWISRGVIIVTIFSVLAVLTIGLSIWPFQMLSVVVRNSLGVFSVLFGLGVITYTGFLLGANRPIALWSNAIMPLLFLLSALYCGAIGILMITAMIGNTELTVAVDQLALYSVILSLLLLFAITFFVQAGHRTPESRVSAEMILNGDLSAMFWFGVVVIGLLLPLILETWYLYRGAGPAALHILAGLMALIGGLFLRQVILAAGVLAPLKVGRFVYRVPYP